MNTSTPHYQRILLKISGETFCHPDRGGIDTPELQAIAQEIANAAKLGTEIAIVVGGGNIIRGAALAQDGLIPQATADHMGMLGTVINALALREALEKIGHPARVQTAINLDAVAEPFIRLRAIRHLEKGRIVIFAGGTGNPFFTTDTAAALRAVEINADILIKATKVDGVYDKDPMKHDDAVKFDHLTYAEAISKNLKVMDAAAFSMCQEHQIPMQIFDFKTPGHIAQVISGQPHGTHIN